MSKAQTSKTNVYCVFTSLNWYNMVQLLLRTPQYYGHLPIADNRSIPVSRKSMEQALSISDSLYYGHQVRVPRVCAIMTFVCIQIPANGDLYVLSFSDQHQWCHELEWVTGVYTIFGIYEAKLIQKLTKGCRRIIFISNDIFDISAYIFYNL